MNLCYNNENSCSYILYKKEDGTEVRNPKTKFDTPFDATRKAMLMNIKESTVHKYTAYKCSKCGWYHIGRTRKVLSDKDRAKAIKFLRYAKK
jgi:hypothetical protein